MTSTVPIKSRFVWLAAVTMLLAASCSLPAQTPESTGDPESAGDVEQPAENAGAAQTPPVPPTGVMITPAGLQRFSTGDWSSLSIVADNPTDEDKFETVSVYFGENPNLQFARKFWLPAESSRLVYLPVRIPETPGKDPGRVDLSSIRITGSGDSEGFAENNLGMPISTRSLMLTDDEVNTALVLNSTLGPLTYEIERQERQIYRVINAARDSIISTPFDLSLIRLKSNFLPPHPRALDEMDQIVLAGDKIAPDTVANDRLRKWIHDGGRVWVMLDQTPPDVFDRLLGDELPLTLVDRVDHNTFTLTRRVRTGLGGGSGEETWSSEQPVSQVRLFCDGAEVAYEIDGWPAAFWKRVGNGEVLVTTLGARGWTDENDVPGLALQNLARRFFDSSPERLESPEVAAAFAPMLERQIGYQIPSAGVAWTILMINFLVLLVAGGYWASKRRLERVAILLPVCAIVATVALVGIGRSHNRAVPSTVATGQLVRLSEHDDEAVVNAVHVVYSQQPNETGFAGDRHSLPLPPERFDRARTQRLLWTDDGKGRWIGQTARPGVVSHFQSESTVPLPSPLVMEGTFDPSGFRGALSGVDGAPPQDALIVAGTAPKIAAEIRASDSAGAPLSVTASEQGLLAREQYLRDGLLSDTQRQRQAFLRSALNDPQRQPFGDGTRLLFWADPVDSGVTFSEAFDERGTALVSIPIQFKRPSPGSQFQIPATFIATEAFAGRRGISSIFNARTGRWLTELTQPAEAELMFRFPKALTPFELNQATLTIKVDAPKRTLTVKALVGDKPEVVFRRENPSGLIECVIDRPEALQWHPAGGLWLSIEVSEIDAGDSETPGTPELTPRGSEETKAADQVAADQPAPIVADTSTDTTTWQIDFVYLDAEGSLPTDSSPAAGGTAEEGNP
jgi:hypothetical protein